MLPSSFTTSASSAAGCTPASLARSTPASVWPGRVRTPPSRARSGKMWPGRCSASGVVVGSASTRAVRARSSAEIPVPVPFASTVMVKAVPIVSVWDWTISGRSRASRRSPGIETQSTPLVWRTMNAVCFGVANSAAMMRSPSFSRSSSSTTSTSSPRPNAAMTSSIGAKGDGAASSIAGDGLSTSLGQTSVAERAITCAIMPLLGP